MVITRKAMQPSQIKNTHALRGELEVCKMCPLRLTCFMKKTYTNAQWCYHCNGWVINSSRLIVQCMLYKPVMSYNEYMLWHTLYCPNCSSTSKTKGTYMIIKLGLINIDHVCFANKKEKQEKYYVKQWDIGNGS